MLFARVFSASTLRIIPDTVMAGPGSEVTLPPPPVWPIANSALRAFSDLAAQLKSESGAQPQMIHQADTFVLPDEAWLAAYTKWFERLRKPLHIEYEAETFDCDKFARCFVAFADLLARKGGEGRASLGVGWATVINETPFGGVGTGGHALVIAATTSGFYIIEPQNGTMTRLDRYPNRAQLQQVNF